MAQRDSCASSSNGIAPRNGEAVRARREDSLAALRDAPASMGAGVSWVGYMPPPDGGAPGAPHGPARDR